MIVGRCLFAAAVCLFSFASMVAAASSDLDVFVTTTNVSAAVPNPTAILDVTSPGLVQIAADNIPDEDKMKKKKWQGKATIEVYMLSDIVNTVGNVTGSPLYGTVWQSLNNLCPARIGNNDNPPCWDADSMSFPIRYKTENGKYGKSHNQIAIISSKFKNPKARTALFGALAGAYQAMTQNDRNCFTVKDSAYNNRYCNVAMQAAAYTEDSHIYMKLTSDIDDDNDGRWNCCETREFVDAKLDAGAVEEFKGIYPTKRDKDRLVGCHMGCRDDERVSNIDVDKVLIDVMAYQFW